MDTDALMRAARQHAETARLMGVDFVPMYRLSGDEDESVAVVAESEAVVADAPTNGISAAAAAKPPELAERDVRVIEPKPATAPSVRVGDKRAALAALQARYEADAPHKTFVTAYTNIVFGEGDPDARLVFIGEAPGEEEDRLGRPFVGKSGNLLNRMIEGMGLKREQVYICNLLKTRPLNNATPTPTESAACAPYLFEQLEIIHPEAVVTLGLPAAKAVLRCEGAMGSLRSRWGNMCLPGGGKLAVMPTYHPAYVLRNYTTETRAKVWDDLKQVMTRLGLKAVKDGAGA